MLVLSDAVDSPVTTCPAQRMSECKLYSVPEVKGYIPNSKSTRGKVPALGRTYSGHRGDQKAATWSHPLPHSNFRTQLWSLCVSHGFPSVVFSAPGFPHAEYLHAVLVGNICCDIPSGPYTAPQWPWYKNLPVWQLQVPTLPSVFFLVWIFFNVSGCN